MRVTFSSLNFAYFPSQGPSLQCQNLSDHEYHRQVSKDKEAQCFLTQNDLVVPARQCSWTGSIDTFNRRGFWSVSEHLVSTMS